MNRRTYENFTEDFREHDSDQAPAVRPGFLRRHAGSRHTEISSAMLERYNKKQNGSDPQP
jgi:hypothetical protein